MALPSILQFLCFALAEDMCRGTCRGHLLQIHVMGLGRLPMPSYKAQAFHLAQDCGDKCSPVWGGLQCLCPQISNQGMSLSFPLHMHLWRRGKFGARRSTYCQGLCSHLDQGCKSVLWKLKGIRLDCTTVWDFWATKNVASPRMRLLQLHSMHLG